MKREEKDIKQLVYIRRIQMNNLLEVKELSKAYGDKQVVRKIQFHVEEGEIVGFIGPNGAGKSTTIKMLVDVEARDEGEIFLPREKYREGDEGVQTIHWRRTAGDCCL
jgi:ABC-type multidrug transport system, ATPase component